MGGVDPRYIRIYVPFEVQTFLLPAVMKLLIALLLDRNHPASLGRVPLNLSAILAAQTGPPNALVAILNIEQMRNKKDTAEISSKDARQ